MKTPGCLVRFASRVIRHGNDPERLSGTRRNARENLAQFVEVAAETKEKIQAENESSRHYRSEKQITKPNKMPAIRSQCRLLARRRDGTRSLPTVNSAQRIFPFRNARRPCLIEKIPARSFVVRTYVLRPDRRTPQTNIARASRPVSEQTEAISVP